MKQAGKTRAAKPLPEAVDRLPRSCVTVFTGSMVIDCNNWEVPLGLPVLVPVCDAKGDVVAMFQVPEDLLPLPISVDNQGGKLRRCTVAWKNLQMMLEISEAENYSGADSEQVSDEEGSHPAEENTLR